MIKQLFLVTLPVAAVLGSYALPIDTPVGQLFLFRLLVLAGAFSIFVMNRRVRWHQDPLGWFSALFLLFWISYGIASMSWTPDPIAGLKDIEALIFGFLLITTLLTMNISPDTKVTCLSRGWIVAYGVCAVLAIWEWTTGQHLTSSFSLAHPSYELVSIVYGTLGNPNNFAATIVLAWPFVLVISEKNRPSSSNMMIRAAVIVSAPILILMAGARLSLIAFAVQMLVWWLINIKRPKRSFTLMFAVGILVGLSVVWVRNGDQVVLNKLAILVNQGFSGHQSLTIRLNLILNGIHMLLHSGGFGVGAGGFEAVMAHGAVYWTGTDIDPHSFWIEITAEYGIFMLIGFIFLFGFMLLRALGGRKLALFENNPAMVCVHESILLVLVGYFFVCNENSTYLTQSVNWMMLATAITYLVSVRISSVEEKEAVAHA
ncbi:MAG: O-antigen ligase family protein [Gammaproteobacteria bacterium]